MIKKILIISVLLFVISFFAFPKFAQADVKPLKVEQNLKKEYKYGSFEDAFSKEETVKDNGLSDILKKEPDRKEPTVLDIFNSLLFVIMLILLTGWVYMKIKKINPEQLLSGKFKKLDENTFKIISSLQLGVGKAIYLIEINDKQLIVGTTSSSVNLLAQMEKNEQTTEIPNECIEKLFDKSEDFKKLEE